MSRVTVCVQASWYNFGTFVDAHSLTRPGIRHKRQPDPHDFARAVDRRGTWIVTVAGCIRDGGYFFHVQVVQAKNIVGDFESNSPIRLDVILPGLLGRPGHRTSRCPGAAQTWCIDTARHFRLDRPTSTDNPTPT
jgi:hypothetical protein